MNRPPTNTQELMHLYKPVLVGLGLVMALVAVTIKSLENEADVDLARADLLAMTTGAVRGATKQADVQLHLDATSNSAWTTVDGTVTTFIDFASRSVDLAATPSRQAVRLRGPMRAQRTCALADEPVIVEFSAGGEHGTVRVPIHSARPIPSVGEEL